MDICCITAKIYVAMQFSPLENTSVQPLQDLNYDIYFRLLHACQSNTISTAISRHAIMTELSWYHIEHLLY